MKSDHHQHVEARHDGGCEEAENGGEILVLRLDCQPRHHPAHHDGAGQEGGHTDVLGLQEGESDLLVDHVEDDSDSQQQNVVQVGVEPLLEGGRTDHSLTVLSEHEVRAVTDQEVGRD